MSGYSAQDRGSTKTFRDDTLFVDATYGDDATGERENPSKPYATITAAIAAASPLDCISIAEGVYFSDSPLAINKPLRFEGEGAKLITSFTVTNASGIRGRLGPWEFSEHSITVHAADSSQFNNYAWLNAAYQAAKTALPNSNPLGPQNRFTIFLSNGYYDGMAPLIVDTDYIDLVGFEAPTWRTGETFGNLLDFKPAGAVIINSFSGGRAMEISCDDVKISKISLQRSSGNATACYLSGQSFVGRDIHFQDVEFASVIGAGLEISANGFDGLIERCLFHKFDDISDIHGGLTIASDSVFEARDSHIGFVSAGGHTFSGKCARITSFGTSNNWSGVTMAGLIEDSTMRYFTASVTGVMRGCKLHTSLSNGSGTYTGIVQSCDLDSCMQGATTYSLTLIGCDATNVLTTTSTDTAVWVSSRISPPYQNALVDADGGSSAPKFFNCDLDNIYPTQEYDSGSGQRKATTDAKRTTAEFHECRISMYDGESTTKTQGKHYGGTIQANLTPGDEALFYGVKFINPQAGTLPSGMAAPMWDINEVAKVDTTNVVTLTLRTSGTTSGAANGHAVAEYFAVNDTIEVWGVSGAGVTASQYEGSFTITGVTYLTDETEITYTNAAVTSDQSTTALTAGNIERTDYTERCEIKGCIVNEDSTLQGRQLSKHLPFKGGGNQFDDENVISKSADYTVLPRDRVIHVDTSGGNVDITCLPEDRQQDLVVRKTHASNNLVIKDDAGSTIATLTTVDSTVVVYSDGTNLFVR